MLATILDGFACLALQVEVGPADPALLIGEYVCGAKLEAEATGLLVQLHRHHVEVEVVPQYDFLQGPVQGRRPLPLIHAVFEPLLLLRLLILAIPDSGRLLRVVVLLSSPRGCSSSRLFHLLYTI